MPLEEEIDTYEKRRHDLLVHEGKYVLISGCEVAGLFDTYSDAIQAGYQRYELKPFLVKQIRAVEQVQFISVESPCLT